MGFLSKEKDAKDDAANQAPEPSDQPPSYSEASQESPVEFQQEYPDEKRQQSYGNSQEPYQGQGSFQNQYPQNQQYDRPPSNTEGYDPLQDPNVYKVQPQLVNIAQAPPQHLNPSYQQYLERDKERIQQGDYPKPKEAFKHGAPLDPGHKNPKSKTGGGAFPGRGGATYNNVANR